MQNHSAKNTPLDMDRWREIIEAWNQSGESQKNYCQRLGLSFNSFTYARSKLLQQDKPETQFIPLTVRSNSEEKNNTRNRVLNLPMMASFRKPRGDLQA